MSREQAAAGWSRARLIDAVVEAFQCKFELRLHDHNVVQALQERPAADSGIPRS